MVEIAQKVHLRLLETGIIFISSRKRDFNWFLGFERRLILIHHAKSLVMKLIKRYGIEFGIVMTGLESNKIPIQILENECPYLKGFQFTGPLLSSEVYG